MTEDRLIKLYMEGDAIGAPYEGKEMFAPPRMDLAPRLGGTDETDTVRCWEEFRRSGKDINPLDWARYFTYNHKPCGYGKAYPDFFQLVKYLDKRGALEYEKLVEISKDRNSMGNGCLALVYPLVCLADEQGLDAPSGLVREYTMMTHAHPVALGACDELADIFWGRNEPVVFGYAEVQYPVEGIGGHADAMSTLHTALWCAQKATKEEVTKECIFIGGDTDSTLALSLLLWGFLGGAE
jgi:ADP-ribosylglycohydrolase